MKQSCITDGINPIIIVASPRPGSMRCRSSAGYYDTISIAAFPTRTPTLMVAVLSLSNLHSIAVGDREADSALVANKALLKIANEFNTPHRIVE